MLFIFKVLTVDVSVMMPLDTINMDGQVKDWNFVQNSLQQLKNGGVFGIMVDVWWGITEPNPNQYKFDGYLQVFEMARKVGLKVQPIMSFHKCGGNVGDSVTIPLPYWALNVARSKSLLFQDQWGNQSDEYIAISADYQKVFPSNSGEMRTPVTIYADFMRAFKNAAGQYLNDGTIDQIQVGLGPCGELRYPSYPSARWSYPGIGAFQAFDPLMKQDFVNRAKQSGFEYNSPPTDAGGYNSRPEQTSFFTSGYKSTFGNFFMNFYQGYLLDHAHAVLDQARSIFQTALATKVAGIHWWYGHASHAAELTAGYYNIWGQNSYEHLAETFGNVQFDFTCLEMTDSQHSGENCNSQPEELVRQVTDAVRMHGGSMGGENALETYSQYSYDQILNQLRYGRGYLKNFTYLRLSGTLLDWNNFNTFKNFVNAARGI
ncbi:Beta-amylase [Hexamita inflata]|uniref:Beta-amylase n=2 Tax=Hexamita inflata TaxID=28002 RepID=A0AA86R7H0_9EUKA|nr:Beta-amylase [Hexamita inflata]